MLLMRGFFFLFGLPSTDEFLRRVSGRWAFVHSSEVRHAVGLSTAHSRRRGVNPGREAPRVADARNRRGDDDIVVFHP